MDNGEVSRWKLTDDPPPSKKKPPSLEDSARQDGHKRKKEKDLPQESASKKKVSAEERFCAHVLKPRNVSSTIACVCYKGNQITHKVFKSSNTAGFLKSRPRLEGQCTAMLVLHYKVLLVNIS